MDEFIKQHFAKLPKDTAGARKDWVPEFRPPEKDDDQYWGAYEGVWIYGEPVISSSVLDSDRYAAEVDLTLRKRGAAEKDVTIRRHRLDLQVKDGKLLIAHAREVGD
ncbi:hypothetical protein [Lentzea indica]|uniref:hypothetical protein n=1 Tax=Lentzea indica TaxID=2604800 RepID=UPI001FE4DE5D|nr:hypothetical protein [Lentzea indica]